MRIYKHTSFLTYLRQEYSLIWAASGVGGLRDVTGVGNPSDALENPSDDLGNPSDVFGASQLIHPKIIFKILFLQVECTYLHFRGQAWNMCIWVVYVHTRIQYYVGACIYSHTHTHVCICVCKYKYISLCIWYRWDVLGYVKVDLKFWVCFGNVRQG